MARKIPVVVRAIAGLAATIVDETLKFPRTLPGLPVRLIGQALQASLKLQQSYSGLVARGDEVFTGLRGSREPGMATFDDDDDDLPAAPAPGSDPRTSAFDLVGEPTDTVAEELADSLADDLAVAGLPLADQDDPPGEMPSAALMETLATGADDMSPAEVAALPDDPAADAVVAVVDELAAEVADEVAEELPDAVPDEVLDNLTADTVADVAAHEGAEEDVFVDGTTLESATLEAAMLEGASVDSAPADEVTTEGSTVPEAAPVDEAAVMDAVAAELIADAAVGGTPPDADEAAVPSLGDLTAGQAPEQTELVDDVVPDVAALDAVQDEVVDLGGPEAAESVSPGSDVTDGAAGEPAQEIATPPDADTATEPAQDTAASGPAEDAGPANPVEDYDSFSIPALRGHLRAYPVETVAALLDYERATRARGPYVTLLRNRLEKLRSDQS
jgi:hypothetical protein